MITVGAAANTFVTGMTVTATGTTYTVTPSQTVSSSTAMTFLPVARYYPTVAIQHMGDGLADISAPPAPAVSSSGGTIPASSHNVLCVAALDGVGNLTGIVGGNAALNLTVNCRDAGVTTGTTSSIPWTWTGDRWAYSYWAGMCNTSSTCNPTNYSPIPTSACTGTGTFPTACSWTQTQGPSAYTPWPSSITFPTFNATGGANLGCCDTKWTNLWVQGFGVAEDLSTSQTGVPESIDNGAIDKGVVWRNLESIVALGNGCWYDGSCIHSNVSLNKISNQQIGYSMVGVYLGPEKGDEEGAPAGNILENLDLEACDSNTTDGLRVRPVYVSGTENMLSGGTVGCFVNVAGGQSVNGQVDFSGGTGANTLDGTAVAGTLNSSGALIAGDYSNGISNPAGGAAQSTLSTVNNYSGGIKINAGGSTLTPSSANCSGTCAGSALTYYLVCVGYDGQRLAPSGAVSTTNSYGAAAGPSGVGGSWPSGTTVLIRTDTDRRCQGYDVLIGDTSHILVTSNGTPYTNVAPGTTAVGAPIAGHGSSYLQDTYGVGSAGYPTSIYGPSATLADGSGGLLTAGPIVSSIPNGLRGVWPTKTNATPGASQLGDNPIVRANVASLPSMSNLILGNVPTAGYYPAPGLFLKMNDTSGAPQDSSGNGNNASAASSCAGPNLTYSVSGLVNESSSTAITGGAGALCTIPPGAGMPTGDTLSVAFVYQRAPIVTTTGSTTLGSPTLTLASAICANGNGILAPGVPTTPAFTTVSSGGGTTTITMSANATATASGVTVECTTYRMIWAQKTNGGMMFLNPLNQMQFAQNGIGTPSTIWNGPVISDALPHAYSYSRSGALNAMYEDGVAVGSLASSVPVLAPADATVYVFNTPTTSVAVGTLQDFALWNTQTSSHEAQKITALSGAIKYGVLNYALDGNPLTGAGGSTGAFEGNVNGTTVSLLTSAVLSDTTGAAIPTGPATSVSGDVVTYSGTKGKQQDSGIAITAISPLISGYCTGTATSSSTLSLYSVGAGGATCGNAPSRFYAPLMNRAGTASKLYARCGTAGVSSSSGVFTVMYSTAPNGTLTSTGITCTMGTGNTCTDSTDTYAYTAGTLLAVQFTTQATETLANCQASFSP